MMHDSNLDPYIIILFSSSQAIPARFDPLLPAPLSHFHPITMYLEHPLVSIPTLHHAPDELHPCHSLCSPLSCLNSLQPTLARFSQPVSLLQSPGLVSTSIKHTGDSHFDSSSPSSTLVSVDAVPLVLVGEPLNTFQVENCSRVKKRRGDFGIGKTGKIQKADGSSSSEGASYAAQFDFQCANTMHSIENMGTSFLKEIPKEEYQQPSSSSTGYRFEDPSLDANESNYEAGKRLSYQNDIDDLMNFLFNEPDPILRNISTSWDIKPVISKELRSNSEANSIPPKKGTEQLSAVDVERQLNGGKSLLQQLREIVTEGHSNGGTIISRSPESSTEPASASPYDVFSATKHAWAGPTLLDIQSALGKAKGSKTLASPVLSNSSISSSLSDGPDEETSRLKGSSTTAEVINSDFMGSSAATADRTETHSFPREALKPSFWQKLHKRNAMEPRHTLKIRSNADTVEDGYRWRKYGQKSIKNSPHPRSYYRCTNNSCPVKKQVERSTQDPGLLLVTYEGIHLHHRPNPLYSMQAKIVEEENSLGFSKQTFRWISSSNLLSSKHPIRSQKSVIHDVFEDLMLQFRNPKFVQLPTRQSDCDAASSVATIPQATDQGLLEDVVPAGVLDALQ